MSNCSADFGNVDFSEVGRRLSGLRIFFRRVAESSDGKNCR